MASGGTDLVNLQGRSNGVQERLGRAGDLYGGSTTLEHSNDPQWLITHQVPPAAHLLTVWSLQDPETAGPTQAFLHAVRPPLQVDEIRSTGGHNTGVWLAVLPEVLRWLSSHLHA
jgi:hypothetical protein